MYIRSCGSMLKPTLVMLALVALSACASNRYEMGSSEKFAADDTEAVLVFGLNSGEDNFAIVYLYLDPIDPVTKQIAGTKASRIAIGVNSWRGIADSSDPQYNVLKLPPGSYAVESATVGTKFGMSDVVTRVRYRPSTSAIEVKAGEVVYGGNFTIKILPNPGSIYPKFKLERSRGNISDAADYISQNYKNISVALKYRSFRPVFVGLPDQ
ncbi:MAG: hypothetical protein MJE12_26890 [Alphaproteobacteria bacterium]|nr:hypothetical protein [Alphaproteobacteria bacterium]